MPKRVIFFLVYNRPDKARASLEALQQAKNIEQYHLLIIRQEGNEEVRQIVDDIDWVEKTHQVVETRPEWIHNGEKAINHNVHLGIKTAFEELHADWVTIIEDDIVVGYDFLCFCEQMISRYGDDDNFVAVNGFSRKPFAEEHLYDYGKFRFYVGNGWALTRRAWEHWLKPVWNGTEGGSWDIYLDRFIRKGYVIMPYCSRSYNIGWGLSSIHTSQDPEHPFYEWMRRSWVGSKPFPLRDFRFDPKLKQVWRRDCVRVGLFDSISISAYRTIARYRMRIRKLTRKYAKKRPGR